MLHIVNLEEIQGMLLRIPDLVDLLDRRDPALFHDVKQWLSNIERVLLNNRMPAAGNVAALRGMLIAAERGVIPVGVGFHGRSTIRKIREAAVGYVLRQTGDLVSIAIEKDRERIAEAVRMTRQVVAVAKAKGLIQQVPRGDDLTNMLKALWQTLSTDADLSPGKVNVEGLVGPYDALIVLDRITTSDIPREQPILNQ